MENIRAFFAALTSFVLAILAFFGVYTPSPKTPTTTPTELTELTETTVAPEEPEKINVIYMIGDGMGFNHLELTEHELGVELFMKTLPLQGSLTTRSANSSVTDSAAAGTALACGVKTNNGCVGVYPTDTAANISFPMSLSELAMSENMKAGFITSDSPYGATPAAFSSHTSSRNNSADIVAQQLTSGLDLMWFAVSSSTWAPEEATGAGYFYVKNRAEMIALENGARTVGEFTASTMWKGERSSVYNVNPSLSELTEKAAELLSSEDGFFLMVEGAHIDKNAHNNAVTETVWAVDEFDNAVEAAVDFARDDGNTVVVVTADHETGGITLADDGTFSFTSGSHTGANIPLFVYGADNLVQQGETIDNTELPALVAALFSDKDFPAEILR